MANSTETLDISFNLTSFVPSQNISWLISECLWSHHRLIPRSQARGWTRDWSSSVNWSRGGGNWPRGRGTKQNKIWSEELEVICYRATSFPIVFRIRVPSERELWMVTTRKLGSSMISPLLAHCATQTLATHFCRRWREFKFLSSRKECRFLYGW